MESNKNDYRQLESRIHHINKRIKYLEVNVKHAFYDLNPKEGKIM